MSIWSEIDSLMDPRSFVGRAPQQTVKFVEKEVRLALEPWIGALSEKVSELNILSGSLVIKSVQYF